MSLKHEPSSEPLQALTRRQGVQGAPDLSLFLSYDNRFSFGFTVLAYVLDLFTIPFSLFDRIIGQPRLAFSTKIHACERGTVGGADLGPRLFDALGRTVKDALAAPPPSECGTRKTVKA